MATFRMKYVKAFRDRHGRMRYYYRRPGFPSIALTGEPGSRAFADAYEAAAQTGRPYGLAGSDRTIPGSFSALIIEYYGSTGYVRLKDITKATYRNSLEAFRKEFGDVLVKEMDAQLLDDVLDAKAKKPGAQQTLRKVLRLILKMAKRRRLIADNPMEGLRMPRKAIKGFPAWAPEQCAAYEKRWASGTRERLAYALLLYTAQRRSDVVTMGRQHVRDGLIHVVQQKTGTRLGVPVHYRLKAELDQIPAGQLTLLQTEQGKPFSAAGFTNWFRECAKEAGVVGCTPHGLRKNASVALVEAGCTPSQVMAVTGHKNLSEVTLYTAAADQEKLAREAMKKFEQRTKLSTRSVKPR
jgi:integrase